MCLVAWSISAGIVLQVFLPSTSVVAYLKRGAAFGYNPTHLSHSLDLHSLSLMLPGKPRVSSEHFPSQSFLLLVDHDCVQLVRLQGRVQESLLHVMYLGPLLVESTSSLGFCFFGGREVVPEFVLRGLRNEYLEGEHDNDRRGGSDTVKPTTPNQASS